MLNHIVMKCPGDFFTLGPHHLLGQHTYNCWHYWRSGPLTATAIDNCMMRLSRRFYSDRFRERFRDGACEAIAFVAHRTHPEFPLNVALVRFMNQGQKCVILIVDSVPLPELRLDLPSPTARELADLTWGKYFTHARILSAVDGYLIVSDPYILQLSLNWSE